MLAQYHVFGNPHSLVIELQGIAAALALVPSMRAYAHRLSLSAGQLEQCVGGETATSAGHTRAAAALCSPASSRCGV